MGVDDVLIYEESHTKYEDLNNVPPTPARRKNHVTSEALHGEQKTTASVVQGKELWSKSYSSPTWSGKTQAVSELFNCISAQS